MLKAAIIQMRSGLVPSDTVAALEPMIRDAAFKGADYIQTPEMTGCVHSTSEDLRKVITSQEDDLINKMAQSLSAELNVAIHIGSTAIDIDGDKVANRALVYENGELKATYDKIHMFDVDLDNGESWRESNTYKPGEEAVTVELKGHQFGLGICYDVRFPHLFRDQAVAGANILTAPAAFTKQTGEAHWHILQRARAIENGAFMISSAQGGLHDDGRETYGHSIIVDPWGKILAEINSETPGVAIADIDIELSVAARAKIPNLKNARDYKLKSV